MPKIVVVYKLTAEQHTGTEQALEYESTWKQSNRYYTQPILSKLL